MKKDMPLEGLRWSRDSGSALYDTPPNGRSRTGWGVFEAHSPEELRDKLLAYYTVDGYSAEVTIDGDFVKVKVDQKDLEQSPSMEIS